MERDPVRFVWRASPGLNAFLVALALAAVPAILVVLDLVAALVDDLALGPALADARSPPTLPERLLERTLFLVPGAPLSRAALAGATVAALVAAAAFAGLYAYAASRLRSRVGRHSVDGLGRRLIGAIALAPVSAYEAARQSATLAGKSLVGQRAVLGGLIGTPALGSTALVAIALYMMRLDLRLLLVVAIGLGAYVLARDLRDRRLVSLGAGQETVGRALRRMLDDLSTNLPALAAHGTADVEQARIAKGLVPYRQAITDRERRLGAATGLVLAIAWATPVAVLGLAAWLGFAAEITPGQGVAATLAAVFGLSAMEALHRWRRTLAGMRPVVDEVARHLLTLRAQRRGRAAASLPAAGTLVAEHVTTDSAPAGGRLSSLELTLSLPAHVALVGETGSGFRTFARAIGGQVVPKSGRILFGGVDLADVDPRERARRIAFAGGRTLLLEGTLRDNLVYGTDPRQPDLDERIADAIGVAGLTSFVYRRGLSGLVDARGEPDLPERIVAARDRIRDSLDEASLSDLVQPFDADSYNPQATIGENILFGVAMDGALSEENLPAQSFMRGLLEREHLTVPLAALGMAIARSTIEMFWGLPNRSSIVGRFSIMSGGERDEFDRILQREVDPGTAATSQDADRLISLAFRYSEMRHRLGLLGPDLEERLLRVRAAFARELPAELAPSIEFFRRDRLCPAASVLDNLLFGRIAQDRASARQDVLSVIRRVIVESGLEASIVRLGLGSRIDPAASGLSPQRSAAIDLVRCLVRRPDNLVVDGILDDLPEAEAAAVIARLRQAMDGRGLVVALPAAVSGLASGFDEVARFAAGRIGARPETEPAPAPVRPPPKAPAAPRAANPWRPDPSAKGVIR